MRFASKAMILRIKINRYTIWRIIRVFLLAISWRHNPKW